MPDFSGPVQPLEWARWLWLIPGLPLLAAALAALYGSGVVAESSHAVRTALAGAAREPAAPAPDGRVVVAGVIACLAGSTLACAVHVAMLAGSAADSRFLFDHVWQCARIGPVDVGVDLDLDPSGAALSLLVLGSALAVASRGPRRDWRFLAWLAALAGSLVVVVMADDLALLFAGLSGVGLAGGGLLRAASDHARRTDASERVFVAARAADGAFCLGVALLFWGLGGGWSPRGDYQPDLLARVAAVSVAPPGAFVPPNDPSMRGGAATEGSGFLTVPALPDALVYADDSRTPLLDDAGLPLRTPFRRRRLAGGVHSLRLAPDDSFRLAPRDGKTGYVVEGGVLPNYSVGRLAFGGGREVALVVLGSTLRLREVRDALALVDASGAHPQAVTLLSRRLFGVSVLGLGVGLLLAGAAGKLAEATVHARAPARVGLLVAAAFVLAAVDVLARVGFALALPHVARVAVPCAVVAGLAAVVAMRRARGDRGDEAS